MPPMRHSPSWPASAVDAADGSWMVSLNHGSAPAAFLELPPTLPTTNSSALPD
jgi:hypothetical protein